MLSDAEYVREQRQRIHVLLDEGEVDPIARLGFVAIGVDICAVADRLAARDEKLREVEQAMRTHFGPPMVWHTANMQAASKDVLGWADTIAEAIGGESDA